MERNSTQSFFFCIKSPSPTVKKHLQQGTKNTKEKCICTDSIYFMPPCIYYAVSRLCAFALMLALPQMPCPISPTPLPEDH